MIIPESAKMSIDLCGLSNSGNRDKLKPEKYLTEYKLPSSVSNFAPDFIPAMTSDAPAEIAGGCLEARWCAGFEPYQGEPKT